MFRESKKNLKETPKSSFFNELEIEIETVLELSASFSHEIEMENETMLMVSALFLHEIE